MHVDLNSMISNEQIDMQNPSLKELIDLHEAFENLTNDKEVECLSVEKLRILQNIMDFKMDRNIEDMFEAADLANYPERISNTTLLEEIVFKKRTVNILNEDDAENNYVEDSYI